MVLCLLSGCGKNKTTDIGLLSLTDDENLGANINTTQMGVERDFEAAEVISSYYPYWKCYNSISYVFDESTLWNDKEES